MPLRQLHLARRAALNGLQGLSCIAHSCRVARDAYQGYLARFLSSLQGHVQTLRVSSDAGLGDGPRIVKGDWLAGTPGRSTSSSKSCPEELQSYTEHT